MSNSESLTSKLYRHRHTLGYIAFAAALLTMMAQTDWIENDRFRSTLTGILGIVFLPCVVLSMYLSLFYTPKPDKKALEASTTDDARQFWNEVKRRRRIFLLTGASWLIVGFPLWWLYSQIIPSRDPMVSGGAALATFLIFWYWTAWRVMSMSCFNCGRKPFDHLFIILKYAKCKNCGTPFKSSEKTSV